MWCDCLLHFHQPCHADFVVRLRTEPRDAAPWVASSTGVVRSWSEDVRLVCTGRSSAGWVHVRAPGGHHTGWVRRRAVRPAR